MRPGERVAQTLRGPRGGIQFRALLAGTRHGNNKFSVFFGNKILCGIGRTAILVFLFNHDHKLLGRFEIEANLSAGTILGLGCLFHVTRCQIHQVDLGNFVAFSVRLHHFVKADNHRIGAGRVEARLQRCRVLGFEGGFVFFDKGLFLFCCRTCAERGEEQNCKDDKE